MGRWIQTSRWIEALGLWVVLAVGISGAACSDSGYVAPDGDVDAFSPGPDAGEVCTGNNDGVITQEELPVISGATANYLVNPPGTTVSVQPNGYTEGDGQRVWDFTSDAGQVFQITVESVQDRWFAEHFPDADYAAVASPEGDTLGVYKVTSEALWLLGYASPDPDSTLAVYDSPVALLRYPLSVGSSWVTVGTIQNATWEGVPFASEDTFRVSVDDRGTVRLPYLDLLNTLRVHVELTQSLPGGTTLRRIQYLYIHECYGEMGRIVSLEGELDPNFTTAAEFRRLAL